MNGAIDALCWIALGERRVNICLFGMDAKTKRWGENSDEGVIHSVQSHRFAEPRWVAAEPISPQTVADDDDWRATRLVLIRRELAAESRWHAQRAEEPRGDFSAAEVLGRAGIRKIVVLPGECRDLLEGASIAPPIEKVKV